MRSWSTSGSPPSKQLGDIKAALEADVAAGLLESEQDADYYVAWVDAHRDRYGL